MRQDNPTTAADATVDDDAHAGLLEDLLARIASCFFRRETRLTCRDMVNWFLMELEDRNCWTLAEAAGRSDLRDVAVSLAHERLTMKPHSAVNRRFLAVGQG